MATDNKRHLGSDIVDEVVEDFRLQRPDVDSAVLELVSRLILTGRAMEADGANAASEFEGHYTDFDVLGMLRTQGPPYEMTPAGLMERVMLTSGAMTACLQRMERNGLITRRTDGIDRRIKPVRLTPAGLERADLALSRRFERSEARLSALNAEDRACLIKLLRRIPTR